MSFFSYGFLVRPLIFRCPIVYQLAIATTACAASPKNHHPVYVLDLRIYEHESWMIKTDGKDSKISEMLRHLSSRQEAAAMQPAVTAILA
ncbi:hypothetical protein BHYA_0270g00040 [Botrytis hyacinthi]|uniref:Uncharacterized protein n=1 Tax=Botrytis hyacinthi TaxID=278943 RepID=A0A4Z1GGM0_9HELO|nr:hypothetical protein BHYA_0270g00040 [Botrytis hyacinthi]